MLTLYEFTVFGLYLAMLTVLMITIQITNPGKQIREALHPQIELTDETFTEHYEDDSEEEKAPFNPQEEAYKMTENPMFSHQESVELKED
jgi:hypothetical protein